MVGGEGDPASSPRYVEAVESLYSVAYAIRFLLRDDGVDEKVMPLDGLWSTDMGGDVWASRDAWRWTMMIAVPDVVDDALLDHAVTTAARKRPSAGRAPVRLERFAEGRAAQVLHVGPYGEAEMPTVQRLHAFIAAQGLRERGRHHEIYLSDARRTSPERLRTILRHPVVD